MSTKQPIESLELRDSLDFQNIVRKQILNCLEVAGDDDYFGVRVDALRRMLPKKIKDSEEFQEQILACVSTYEEPIYSTFCGVAWGKPTMIAREIIDWNAIFEIVLNKFESLGVTWQKVTKASSM